MTRKPSSLPLTAFDPRYKELMLRGSREEVRIPCASRKEAVALRHRLQTYRSRAKKHYGEEHREEWEPLYLCIGTIIDDLETGKAILKLSPRHMEFSHILDAVPEAQPERPTALGGLLDELENDK